MSKARKVPEEDKVSKRCHYNKHRRAKISFGCEDDAAAFIAGKGLVGYAAYLCRECSMWHVGKTGSSKC